MKTGIVKTYRRIERAYWIAVIMTEDWNEDDCMMKLVEKSLTRHVLISKPCYRPQ